MRYAENTSVSSERSKAEIERLLTRYKADQFMMGSKDRQAVIGFRMNNKMIRFNLPLPSRTEERFKQTATGRIRRHQSEQDIEKQWEQACRQAWRALALVIKAKLEAVAAGITEFENEFLAHIVLPDGKTVAEHVRPGIETAYKTGKLLPLLPWVE
jgi:hypothetical protein